MGKTHAHRLKLHTYKKSGYKIYFCTLPDCNYKVKRELVLGKRAICWRCNKEFIMNENSIRLVRPHCDDCKGTKEIKVTIPIEFPVEAEKVTTDLKRKLLKAI